MTIYAHVGAALCVYVFGTTPWFPPWIILIAFLSFCMILIISIYSRVQQQITPTM